MKNIIKENNTSSADQDSSKDRIMRAALEEFSFYGLAGSRVDRIAQKAGINKAMIYYHFSSKENLYRESIKAFIRSFTLKIKSSIDKTGSPVDTLNNIANAYADLFIKDSHIRPILLRELVNSNQEMVEQVANVFIESNMPYEIRSVLEEGVTNGFFRQADIRQAVVSFLMMNIGYFIVSPIIDRILKVENRTQFIEERKKAVVDLFLNGLKAR